MAGITVKEKLYLLEEGDIESLFKHTFWDEDFAEDVYERTIDALEEMSEPLTFDTFLEEIVMQRFFGRCRERTIEDMKGKSDREVIKEALELARLSDIDKDAISNADKRDGAIDLMAMIECEEEYSMVYQEAKAFLDAVGIFVIDDMETEKDDVFNDPNNVLFHSDDKLYIHGIYYQDGKPRRIRFYNHGDIEVYSEYDQFIGTLDSKGFLSIRRNPNSYV